MKAILAGLFVFGGLFGVVALLSVTGLDGRLPGFVIGGVMALGLIGLVLGALVLFNGPGAKSRGRSHEDEIRELEQKGLLTERRFKATRALVVEEFEDEGIHYFIELADGAGVLFLGGQYLWEYEYGSELGSKQNSSAERRFPCRQFVVRRQDGYGVDILIEGPVVDAVDTAPPFSLDDWKNDRIPADGAIISDLSYDEIKRRYLKT